MDHRTLIETRTERISRGKPVVAESPSDIYQALGGLTHFSSLASGSVREEAVGSLVIEDSMMERVQRRQGQEIEVEKL